MDILMIATPAPPLPAVLSAMHVLVVIVIIILIFGPGKLGELGKSLGTGIKNFKSAVNEGKADEHDPEKKN